MVDFPKKIRSLIKNQFERVKFGVWRRPERLGLFQKTTFPLPDTPLKESCRLFTRDYITASGFGDVQPDIRLKFWELGDGVKIIIKTVEFL